MAPKKINKPKKITPKPPTLDPKTTIEDIQELMDVIVNTTNEKDRALILIVQHGKPPRMQETTSNFYSLKRTSGDPDDYYGVQVFNVRIHREGYFKLLEEKSREQEKKSRELAEAAEHNLKLALSLRAKKG